jgi:hypothetical protein
LKLKGISTNSQVSSTFYSTKTYPLTHKDDEGDSTSPSTSDFNGPLPPFHQCSVIHTVSKGFFSQIDWPALQKDFSSKKNRDLRHTYHARFSEREKDLIKVQWTRKMIESQKHILFFDFLQEHFPSDNALNVVKKNFLKKTRQLFSLLILFLQIFSLIVMELLSKVFRSNLSLMFLLKVRNRKLDGNYKGRNGQKVSRKNYKKPLPYNGWGKLLI